MKEILDNALEQTQNLWIDIIQAYEWIYAIAKILENKEELHAQVVRSQYYGLLGSIIRWQKKTDRLTSYIQHFQKVTTSYSSGLFHCYWQEGMHRTNNNLEQLFGSFRHHQRRCTGFKKAPSTTVITGSVKIIAMISTKIKTFTEIELAQINLTLWRQKRQEINSLRQSRLQQRHFRRDPDSYLARLEEQLLQRELEEAKNAS